MTIQPTMFGYAIARTRQPALFDTDGPPAVTARCARCGEYLERTPSGYLACPRGDGKLLTDVATDDRDATADDESLPPQSWPEQARRIAKTHAKRDNWHGRRWRCQCGGCSRARLDGFVPREHGARDR